MAISPLLLARRHVRRRKKEAMRDFRTGLHLADAGICCLGRWEVGREMSLSKSEQSLFCADQKLGLSVACYGANYDDCDSCDYHYGSFRKISIAEMGPTPRRGQACNLA